MAYFLLIPTEITSEAMRILTGNGLRAVRELKPFEGVVEYFGKDKKVPQGKVKQ